MEVLYYRNVGSAYQLVVAPVQEETPHLEIIEGRAGIRDIIPNTSIKKDKLTYQRVKYRIVSL